MADYADLLEAEKTQTEKKAPPSLSSKPAKKHVEKKDVTIDAPEDVTTSPRNDVNYRAWRDVIENTVTRNSSLRLTSEEKYEIEDVVKDLDRSHKLTTSLNEMARLGLVWLVQDYKKNKSKSLLYKVKKS